MKEIDGCQYIDGSDKYRRCKWFDGLKCTHENGAILTSTLLGAHPADCPLLEEEEAGK